MISSPSQSMWYHMKPTITPVIGFDARVEHIDSCPSSDTICNNLLWFVSQYCPLWAPGMKTSQGSHIPELFSLRTLTCRVIMGYVALTSLKRVVTRMVSTTLKWKCFIFLPI